METTEPKFIQVHTEVTRYIEDLHEKQEHLHKQYKEYLEQNKSSKVFGLDSFYYQSRLLDLEAKHLNEQYLFINNRIYCDYYKLYGMVKVFYKDSFKLEPKKRNYPVYKDLETFKSYDIQESVSLNIDITEMIKKSYAFVHKNEEELQKQTSNTYLNIDNYIYNHNYNNSILKKRVELYEKYLHSYHIYHMSFLSQLRDKFMLLFRQSTNSVILGKTDSWVDEPVVSSYPVESLSKYVETEPPIEIVIHPVQSLTEVTNEVFQAIHVEVQAVAETVSEVTEAVPEKVSEVTEAVPEKVSEVSKVVTQVTEAVAEEVTEVSKVVTQVTEVAEEVTEVSKVVTQVTEVSEEVSETVSEVTKEVSETVTEVSEEVSETVSEVTKEVSETVSEVIEEVAEEASEVSEAGSETVSEVIEEVVEEVSEVSEAGSETVSEVSEELTEELSEVVPVDISFIPVEYSDKPSIYISTQLENQIENKVEKPELVSVPKNKRSKKSKK